MDRLRGKVAIVVGSATGMGAAGAALMAEEGANVVLADTNIADAEARAADIRRAGGATVALEVDIANEPAVEAMVAFTVKEYGGVDVLHNNAANFAPEVLGPDMATDILHLDLDVFDRTIAVNLRGFILTMKYAVPEMVKRGSGSIINTSSGVSLLPQLSQRADLLECSRVAQACHRFPRIQATLDGLTRQPLGPAHGRGDARLALECIQEIVPTVISPCHQSCPFLGSVGKPPP